MRAPSELINADAYLFVDIILDNRPSPPVLKDGDV